MSYKKTLGKGLEKLRDFAREHYLKVLGGMAALVVVGGLSYGLVFYNCGSVSPYSSPTQTSEVYNSKTHEINTPFPISTITSTPTPEQACVMVKKVYDGNNNRRWDEGEYLVGGFPFMIKTSDGKTILITTNPSGFAQYCGKVGETITILEDLSRAPGYWQITGIELHGDNLRQYDDRVEAQLREGYLPEIIFLNIQVPSTKTHTPTITNTPIPPTPTNTPTPSSTSTPTPTPTPTYTPTSTPTKPPTSTPTPTYTPTSTPTNTPIPSSTPTPIPPTPTNTPTPSSTSTPTPTYTPTSTPTKPPTSTPTPTYTPTSTPTNTPIPSSTPTPIPPTPTEIGP